MGTPRFNIAAVERDTGLSKDVLRMWERRYGFPVPDRDGNGERGYPAEQVERLRLIKRLMDQGHRPGKLIAASTDELAQLAPRRRPPSERQTPEDSSALDELLMLIKNHQAASFHQAMQQRLARQGLQRFVQDTVAPLTELVGQAWQDGRFAVFEEHLYTELTNRLLRQVIATLPITVRGPRILLTSLPNELHLIGLLMVEALLALEGAECIPLGTQTPLLEIVQAVQAHRADIVALSFSVAFPQRQISGLLLQLRDLLPTEVEIWAGGSGVARLSSGPGIRIRTSLEEALSCLADWRTEHP